MLKIVFSIIVLVNMLTAESLTHLYNVIKNNPSFAKVELSKNKKSLIMTMYNTDLNNNALIKLKQNKQLVQKIIVNIVKKQTNMLCNSQNLKKYLQPGNSIIYKYIVKTNPKINYITIINNISCKTFIENDPTAIKKEKTAINTMINYFYNKIQKNVKTNNINYLKLFSQDVKNLKKTLPKKIDNITELYDVILNEKTKTFTKMFIIKNFTHTSKAKHELEIISNISTDKFKKLAKSLLIKSVKNNYLLSHLIKQENWKAKNIYKLNNKNIVVTVTKEDI